MDWTDLIKLFLVGAFPWVSELRNLDIHFEQPGIKSSSIFNFFASLFAMGLFVYSYYVNPYQLLQLPDWWYFLLAACILTIGYFSIFMFNKEKVKLGIRKGIVILNFTIYILIFCCLTISFGLLKVYKDYVVIKGKVLSSNGQPTMADFTLDFANDKYVSFKSNSLGYYTLMLPTNDIKLISRIEARNDAGEIYSVNTFGEISVFNYLKEFHLRK